MNKYQGIILAGGVDAGNLLYPLCGQYPKALLPIGNKPMIAYQLECLENAGFTDIIVVMTENNASVAKGYGKFKSKIEWIIVDDATDSGSALLQIGDKIKRDFIIFSCDTIADINLLDVIDQHTTQQSIITMVCKEENIDKKLGKAPISCNLDDTYDIMLVADRKLVHIVNADENAEEICVKKALLTQYDEIEIRANLFDSHIYVCKQQLITILQQLAKKVEIQNFKEDILPLIVKNQCNQELLKLYHTKFDLFQQRKQKTFNVGIYITKGYVRRVNNIKDYQQANYDSLIRGDKQIKVFTHSHNNDVHQTQSQAKISPDSVIGEDCQIADKVTIQRSIIGKHCKIENNVKISNSIIFRECVIHSGSIVQNCILSSNTYVEQNCILDRCQTGFQQQIEQNSKKVDEAIC